MSVHVRSPCRLEIAGQESTDRLKHRALCADHDIDPGCRERPEGVGAAMSGQDHLCAVVAHLPGGLDAGSLGQIQALLVGMGL